MEKQKVYTLNIAQTDYKTVWDLQERMLQYNLDVKKLNRSEGTSIDTISAFIFCEHQPVYTLGKSGEMKNLLWSEDQLKKEGIEFHHINRGGDITYHGPGQITGYPVLDLECFKPSAAWYIDRLEELIIEVLAEYGIKAYRIDGLAGVWLEPDSEQVRKICAIGVKMSRWVAIHGFAFNISTDLTYYDHIVPCGIDDKGVTSLNRELDRDIPLDEVINVLKNKFSKLFNSILEPISLNELERMLENGAKA